MALQNIKPDITVPGIIVSVLLLVSQTVSGAVLSNAATQCYSDLGCFPNGPPWTSPGRPVPPPQSPEVVGTMLYCYSRASTQRYNITLEPQIALNGCPVNVSKSLVFITHGFYQNGNQSWLNLMKDEVLKAVDVVVFLVDWGPGATTLNYFQAASNARIVGAVTARFINFLYKVFMLTPRQVHLIGFSLGAHVMSYASNNASTVFSITGLEPAQPAFEGQDPEVRLDITDAQVVDIVHTSAKPLAEGGFGYVSPNGDIDIYVNGGSDQPGCPVPSSTPQISSLSDLFSVPLQYFLQIIFCSHARAYMYYTYSIHNCSILARQTTYSFQMQATSALMPRLVVVGTDADCGPLNCTYMGLRTPLLPARGVFAANTTSTPPFCGSPGDTALVP